jgi:hypothetical protein
VHIDQAEDVGCVNGQAVSGMDKELLGLSHGEEYLLEIVKPFTLTELKGLRIADGLGRARGRVEAAIATSVVITTRAMNRSLRIFWVEWGNDIGELCEGKLGITISVISLEYLYDVDVKSEFNHFSQKIFSRDVTLAFLVE